MVSTSIDVVFKSILMQVVRTLQRDRIPFGATRLIKLVYLVELEYYRCYQNRITGVDWVYYKFGPYVMNYPEYFQHGLERLIDEDNDYHLITISYDTTNDEYNKTAQRIVERVVKEFGDLKLNDLLDYVYYNTEPMMAVENRGDIIDFTIVPTKQDTRTIEPKISEYKYNKLLNELRTRAHHAIEL